VHGDWRELLARGFARVLVVLTLLPFTPPFQACDLGHLSNTHFPGSGEQTPSANLLADGSCSHALPSSNLPPRIRFDAIETFKRQIDRPASLSPGLTRLGLSPAIESPLPCVSALRI